MGRDLGIPRLYYSTTLYYSSLTTLYYSLLLSTTLSSQTLSQLLFLAAMDANHPASRRLKPLMIRDDDDVEGAACKPRKCARFDSGSSPRRAIRVGQALCDNHSLMSLSRRSET